MRRTLFGPHDSLDTFLDVYLRSLGGSVIQQEDLEQVK